MDKLFGILIFLYFNGVLCQVGDLCRTKSGQNGKCTLIRNCQAAIDDIRRKVNPTICAFQGMDPIVCCASASVPPRVTTPTPPVATTPKRGSSTTVPNIPVYDYHNNNQESQCEPVSANLTAPKTGRKAWDKCIDYQQALIYPCVKGTALTGEMTRVVRCNHAAKILIVGGQEAAIAEFPHMALLGYGDTAQNAAFLCGGTLISERYIMTAGHCTFTREYGAVTFAVLGAQKRSDPINENNLYRIVEIIKHPNYKPPSKYNDIALLKTDREVALSSTIVPACIHLGNEVNEERAEATGWGAVAYRGSSSETLQKVTLDKFSTAECKTQFQPGMRHMENGFDEKTQTCYGDKKESKDACQGDSGGPMQVPNMRITCMYTIVGVTSFGKACGFVGEGGIYTRVAAFAPWIESVVWP